MLRDVFLLTLISAATLYNAAPRCPDPKLQKAAIGGNTVNGGVELHKKPLKFAKVRLYSSSEETAWIGKTDKDGAFRTTRLPPDDYRLEISGWGSTTIRLDPEIDKGLRQTPSWSLLLMDNGCVGTMQVTN
jgi:hypothetical protein